MLSVEVCLLARSPLRPEAFRRLAGGLAARLPALRRFETLSIVTVSPARMAVLNARRLGKPYPTNVLAFPFAAAGGQKPTGEVFLCPSVIRAEADQRGLTVRLYTAYLLIHGILHCLGHDHGSPIARHTMERLENRLLVQLRGLISP